MNAAEALAYLRAQEPKIAVGEACPSRVAAALEVMAEALEGITRIRPAIEQIYIDVCVIDAAAHALVSAAEALKGGNRG